jgi:hypothetical protein
LVGVIFFPATAEQWGDLKEVEVASRWKKIFDYDNRNSNAAKMTMSWTKGFRNLHREEESITASHQFSMTLGVNAAIYKVVSLNIELGYQYTDTTQQLTMTEKEIYGSRQVTVEAEIAPKTRLVRWQLVADVDGEQIGCDYIVDSIDQADNPPIQRSSVMVLLRRQIELGKSFFRIMHKNSNLYMTVVKRLNWPAATLGLNSHFYFSLDSAGSGRYRIKTHNSTDEGYNIMYASDKGGIYFDREYASSPKQLWTISKPFPLYLEDEVAFKNGRWTTAGLCYHKGIKTDIYCMFGKEDVWILC